MVVTDIIHKTYELLNYLEETFDSGFQADQGIMVFVLYSNYVWHGWSLRIHAQDAKSSEEEKDDLYRSGVKRWSWSLMDRHGFKCYFHHFLAFSIYHTPSCAVMCCIVSPTSNICMLIFQLQGLPWWLRQVRICLQCRKPRFDPWVQKIPWRREWQPTPVFLPGEFHGQRRLVRVTVPGVTKSRAWLNNLHVPFSF